MCNICLEYEKGKMTDAEALRALGEMVNLDPNQQKPDYHYYEAIDRILDRKAEGPEHEDSEE